MTSLSPLGKCQSSCLIFSHSFYYARVCGFVHVSAGAQEGFEGTGSPAAGAAGSCDPDTGAGSQTIVPCKSSKRP